MKIIGWIIIICSILLALEKGHMYTTFEGITNFLTPIIGGIICIYIGKKKKKEENISEYKNKANTSHHNVITDNSKYKSYYLDSNLHNFLFDDNTKNITITFLYDLASIDKEICSEERKFLYHIMDKYNILSSQLKHIDNQEELKHNIQCINSLSNNDKVLFVVYMYLLIIIDGDANLEEKNFFKKVTQNINIAVSFDEFEDMEIDIDKIDKEVDRIYNIVITNHSFHTEQNNSKAIYIQEMYEQLEYVPQKEAMILYFKASKLHFVGNEEIIIDWKTQNADFVSLNVNDNLNRHSKYQLPMNGRRKIHFYDDQKEITMTLTAQSNDNKETKQLIFKKVK